MSKNKITGLIGIVAMFFIASLPINTTAKIGLTILIFALVFYINRAFFYFMRGNKILMSKKQIDFEKVWQLYEKAYKAKLPFKYRVTMGNILALRGDAEFAKEVLNSVIDNCKDQQLVNKAKVQKSMTLERLGDINGAIKILDELHKNGYKDRSLSINLSSYLIFIDKIEESKKILRDSKDLINSSTGLLDNKGWIYILENEWDKAAVLFKDVVEREPKFPDPYIHYAQVKLHFGQKKEAINLLNTALEKTWSKVTFFNKEITTSIKDKLEQDTSNDYIYQLNNSSIEVSKGFEPKEIEKNLLEELRKKEFTKEPIEIEEIEENQENDDQIEIEISEEDDSLPNTDLTEDDLKWEENHKE